MVDSGQKASGASGQLAFGTKVFKAADCLFVVLASVLFLAVAVNVAGAQLGMWELPERSDLESRNYTTFDSVPSLDGVLKGKFQTKANKWVADKFPFRDDALIKNAALQRHMIEVAKLPFGYEIYPTFFGSSRVYCEQFDAVYPIPSKKDEFDKKYWNKIGDALEALVSNSSESINWRLALVERDYTTVSMPTHDLVSNVADYDYFESKLAEKTPKAFELVDLSLRDSNEYAFQYFRTDHHMQVQGSVVAYEKILRSLGREPQDFSKFYVAFDGQSFGSNARLALCDIAWDDIYDVDYEHSNLRIVTDRTKEVDYGTIDKLHSDDGMPYQKTSKYKQIGFHSAHYHLIEFENLDLDESAGSLLLIGDSFTDNCGRLFAESYKHVYELDPRFFQGSMKEFLAKHEIDDAVIFGSMEVLELSDAQKCFKS